MSDKCRPCLRQKTLCNVWFSELSNTDKDCIQAVFDKFEEQQAEIERLKKGVNIELENYASEYDNKIKAEAVKEFAENLETALSDHFGGGFYKCHCRHVIDNLLKERVGDADD